MIQRIIDWVSSWRLPKFCRTPLHKVEATRYCAICGAALLPHENTQFFETWWLCSDHIYAVQGAFDLVETKIDVDEDGSRPSRFLLAYAAVESVREDFQA